MAKSSTLRSKLHKQQGRNFRLEKQRKHEKAAEKKRAAKAQEPEDEVDLDEDEVEEGDWEDLNGADEDDADDVDGGILLNQDDGEDDDSDDEEDYEDAPELLDISHLDDSDSSSDDDDEADDDDPSTAPADEDEDADIPLSDLDSLASDEKGDLIPHQRLTINNKPALLAALRRIQLPTGSQPFSVHQSVTTTEPVAIPDVDDDLNRELGFYKQSLSAAVQARAALRREGVAFSRPVDYFAEMVKSDEHMGRVKQKLVDAAAGKKAAAEARRQRDLKKFGKQVQVAKLQERQKAKRETMEKIGALKRKRANGPLTNETEEDIFDVGLDKELDRPAKRNKRDGRPSSNGNAANAKRQKKNEKYGFGGKKRHSKSGDAFSSADMRDFPGKGMKGGFGGGKGGGVKKRPGKARRAKGRL